MAANMETRSSTVKFQESASRLIYHHEHAMFETVTAMTININLRHNLFRLESLQTNTSSIRSHNFLSELFLLDDNFHLSPPPKYSTLLKPRTLPIKNVTPPIANITTPYKYKCIST
jgi:hypothetical protein